MVAPVALADPAARDPPSSGMKAARLAAAAGGGLPVLPGWVLPLDASSDAVARGMESARDGVGAPAAYLAAMESETADLAEELMRPMCEHRRTTPRRAVLNPPGR